MRFSTMQSVSDTLSDAEYIEWFYRTTITVTTEAIFWKTTIANGMLM